MKAKRRHDLQENVLSGEILHIVEFFKARGVTIAWGMLVIAVIVIVVLYVRGRSQETAVELQRDFDRATMDASISSNDRIRLLRTLAQQDDNSRIAALSAVKLGDIYAAQMTAIGPYADPAEYKSLSGESARWYRRVIDNFSEEQLALGNAHFALGRLAENRGDFETARAEYQKILRVQELTGYPVFNRASISMKKLDRLIEPVRMATTAPATQPANGPVIEPDTGIDERLGTNQDSANTPTDVLAPSN